MIQAFAIKISGSNLSVKRISQVTTNAKNQYYATVELLDIWQDRNVTILFNGVGMAVVDGVCLLPQLTSTRLTIGVLSVDDETLFNTVTRSFIITAGADSADVDVPTVTEWETYTLEIQGMVDTAKSYSENPPKIVDGESNWYIWNGSEYVDSGIAMPSGTLTYGDGLKVSRDNVLSVDTVDDATEDNTKPITSGAVYREIGNIDALLELI